jgi:hypothetical protein
MTPQEARARRRPYITLGLVLFAVTAFTMAQFGWWDYMTIAIHQQTAPGKLLTVNCRNNNEIRYNFSVNGTTHEGSASWPDCRNLTTSDPLQISYSSIDPTKNVPGDAYARFISETISILISSVLSSFLVVYVLMRRKTPMEQRRDDARR